jgi:hypothetical protein
MDVCGYMTLHWLECVWFLFRFFMSYYAYLLRSSRGFNLLLCS